MIPDAAAATSGTQLEQSGLQSDLTAEMAINHPTHMSLLNSTGAIQLASKLVTGGRHLFSLTVHPKFTVM